VTTYTVTSASTGKANGRYESLDAALAALPDLLTDGDDYQIVSIPDGTTVGAGTVEAQGRYRQT
jgi:hypothetical protein